MKQRSKGILLLGAMIAVMALVAGAGSTPKKTINFRHNLHVVDMEMVCSDCHSGITEDKSVHPDHDVCSSCHDVEDDCGYCHVDPDNPESYVVEQVFENFAHSKHGAECSSCHGKLSDLVAEPTRPMLPDCQMCHEHKSVKPQSHLIPLWTRQHGEEAEFVAGDCAVCHTQSSCDECHQGENIFETPHPESWIHDHAVEAGWKANCLACHESNEQCLACHRVQVPVPHPFGAKHANVNDGGTHKDDVKAFPETCVTCHDLGGEDPTCAKCHQ